MKKGKKRYTKKDVFQQSIITFFLVSLVILFGYIILNAEWLRPRINELSASYISLKNQSTTDLLKINNLRKLTDEKGMSNRNSTFKTFQVTGQKGLRYQIVLYHLGNKIDEKYIKYYLLNDRGKKVEGNVKESQETKDGGRIIYEGTIEEGKNWNLKMWVDKEYQEEINNISYEIRIKTS